MRATLVLAIAACSAPSHPAKPDLPAPPMLAALPKPVAIDTPRFAGIIVCDRCHTAGATAMRDRRGSDISPVREVLGGMMGLSARDPYYLAALRREIDANPAAKSVIEATCNRCHAPVGFAEASALGGALSLDDLTASASPAAVLGREGIGCAGCHSLEPSGLGEDPSFTGAAALRTDRVSYGALPAPLIEAMVQMSKTTPVPSKHVSESRLCASCHTVLVHRLDATGAPTGDEIPEQATFLEWRASDYADGGPRATTCQGCHMPRGEDELGKAPPIATPFATRPPDAPVREGYRRHALRGGNAYMLERMADAGDWLGVPAAPLRDSATATRQFLQSAARIDIAGTASAIAITVTNLTGHKLPTGYPTRRMWLEIRVVGADGTPSLVSGGTDKTGALVDAKGRRLDPIGVIAPHVTRIRSSDHVIVWEAVPVDEHGKRTHLLLGTAAIAKDNRLLPAGWRPDHADAKRTRPIGVDGDRDFVPGSDTVIVEPPPGARGVYVRLLYQSVPPETLDSYKPTDSREAARFLAITRTPPLPLEVARAQHEFR